ncbi:MAG: helix-turn-helix domain-containing protein [Acidobacteriota bacterium]|nr:helix-turn-helix domain-containing protein [Acidobacteriota bacterium]
MTDPRLPLLFDELEARALAAPAADLAEVLGRLEATKLRLWLRATAPVSSPPSPITSREKLSPAMATPLLTPAKAAARLGRSTSWIYRHRDELPHVVLPGGRFAFSEPALAKWLAERSAP